MASAGNTLQASDPLIIVDGEIDENEMKLWSLTSHFCGLPTMSVGDAIEYMTKTSKARFKIGRKQMDGNLFDLVINDPVGKDISQLESWGAIKNYLGKIM